MGQTQSSIRHENPATDDIQIDGHGVLSKKKYHITNNRHEKSCENFKTKSSTVEPLEKWTNDDLYKFEVISPQSDVSNPSQFRHRQNLGNQIKEGSIGTRVQTSRYRTSKVCSKQNPVARTSSRGEGQHDCIPPPSKFYFQPETEGRIVESDDREAAEDEDGKDTRKSATVEQKNQTNVFDKANTSLKLKYLIIKAKCMKAKERLSECWVRSYDHHEIKHQKTFETQYTTSMNPTHDEFGSNPIKSPLHLKPSAYLQLEETSFQPIWKEQSVGTDVANMHVVVTSRERIEGDNVGQFHHSIQPCYLHSEDKYVERLAIVDPNTVEKEVKYLQHFCVDESGVDNTNVPVQALFDSDDGQPLSCTEKGSSSFGQPRQFSKSNNESIDTQTTQDNVPFRRADASTVKQQNRNNISKIEGGLTIMPCDRNSGESHEAKNNRKNDKVIPAEKPEASKLCKKEACSYSKVSTPILLNSDGKQVHLEQVFSSSHTTTNHGATSRKDGVLGKHLIHNDEFKSKETAKQNGAMKSFPGTRACVGNAEKSKTIRGGAHGTQRNFSKANLEFEFLPAKQKFSGRSYVTRRSLPQLSRRRTSTTSIASMLQESYLSKYISTDDSSSDEEQQIRSRHSEPASLKALNERNFALPNVSSPHVEQNYAFIDHCSPALSVGSISSTSSKPMLSDEVKSNAAFLFSPSYVEGDVSKIRASAPYGTLVSYSSGFSISTFGSRSRVSSTISKPIAIPIRSSDYFEDESRKSDRRVRFSDGDIPPISSTTHSITDDMKKVSDMITLIPNIESKLSDLTDTTADHHNVPSLQRSIAENKEAISLAETLPTEALHFAVDAEQYCQTESCLDSVLSLNRSDEQKITTPFQERRMRWSYRSENGLDIGVTPLLRDRSTPSATNSPYLRFQAARNKFGGLNLKNGRQSNDSLLQGSSVRLQKEYPLKRRSSPIHKSRGSIVFARVTSMEAWRAQQMERERSKRQSDFPTRQTALEARDSLSERSSLSPIQPFALPHESTLKQGAHDVETITPWVGKYKKLPDDVKVIVSVEAESPNTAKQCYSETDKITSIEERVPERSFSQDSPTSDIYDDVFRRFVDPASKTELFPSHGKMLEQRLSDAKGEVESEIDVFDEFLQEEESETESVTENGSIATLLQQRGSNISLERKSEYRYSLGETSAMSSSTVKSEVASVATIRQVRHSTATMSECSTQSGIKGFQMQTLSLVFRDEATVKPSKLNQTRNMDTVSQSQHPPVHAIKWRALAAAAQEKDNNRVLLPGKKNSLNMFGESKRSSLTERNQNTFGR